MMENIYSKIADTLIDNGTIARENKDLYTYGFARGMSILLNVSTTILIGLVFGMVWQSLVFTLAYIPIRAYAGGYHAKTQLRCYLFSIVIIVAVLLLMKLVPWTGFICSVITLCSGLVIAFLAPVEDSNKPLDQQEKAVYRKRTYIILGVLVGIALGLWFIGYSSISICIVMALFVLSIMLVLGKSKKGFNPSLSAEAED